MCETQSKLDIVFRGEDRWLLENVYVVPIIYANESQCQYGSHGDMLLHDKGGVIGVIRGRDFQKLDAGCDVNAFHSKS